MPFERRNKCHVVDQNLPREPTYEIADDFFWRDYGIVEIK